MTEYTELPEVIEVFRDPVDRTANWVHSQTSFSDQLCSPDCPRSPVEDIEVEGRGSDRSSSSSLPPKMMLRYSDGRGDVPISHQYYDGRRYPHRQSSYREPAPHSRPQTPHRYSHDRSRSVAGHRPVHHYHGYDDYYHSEKYGQLVSPNYVDYESAPEEIQVLPADPNAKPQPVSGSYRPRRLSEPFKSRPKSQPSRDSDVYGTPPPRYVSNTLNVPPVPHSHSQHIHDPYDHHHLSRSQSRGNRPRPSIVHVSSHNRNPDHYAPPTIVYPPNKAPGMNHAVSSSTGSGHPHYPRVVPTPYPPVHKHRVPAQEEQRHGPHGPRGPRPREDMPRSHTPVSEAASGESGGTFYVLQTPGQKVKALAGTEPSLYSGSATTKSASMPRTPDSITGRGLRWPRFSLKSFGSFRKSMHRRHSVDISTRSQSRDRR